MFTSNPRAYYSHMMESCLDAFAGREGAKPQAAKKVFLNFVILPLMFQALSDLISSAWKDRDDNYKLKDYLKQSLLGPWNGPFMTGFAADALADNSAQMLLNLANDDDLFHKVTTFGAGDDIIPVFSDTFKAVPAIKKLWQDYDDADLLHEINAISSTLTLLPGQPGQTAGAVQAATRELNRANKTLEKLGLLEPKK
jgi:hypothetical protein